MDVVPYLSAVILISTIATIFLAVLSYAAFKIRDKRKPKAKAAAAAPVFFHRYKPAAPAADAAEDAAEPSSGDAA
jgi:hypothetical protein